jgi:alcohol dehydrogenase
MPGKARLAEFPLPRIGPDAALLKVEMAGICGSDPKLFRGELPTSPFPIVPGHETLGRIVEVGAAFAQAQGVAVGDRVIVEANVRCGTCLYCQRGDHHFCQRPRTYGLRVPATEPPHLWGAWADYMYLAPGTSVHKIAAHVPASVAVMSNAVVANGIQWLRIVGGASPGDTVVIRGVGAIGLAAIVAARELGAATVVMTGLHHHQDRFDIARALGADVCIDTEAESATDRLRDVTSGRMADVVLDVTGSPDAVHRSVELVRKMGTVVLGGLAGKAGYAEFNFDQLVWNQVRVQGVFSKNTQAVVEAIGVIESGRYPLERLMTATYPLEHAEQAVRAMGREVEGFRPIKVALDLT